MMTEDQQLQEARRLVDDLTPACVMEEALSMVVPTGPPCTADVTHRAVVHKCGDPLGAPITACRRHLHALADSMEVMVFTYKMPAVRCPRCGGLLRFPFGVIWEVIEL